MEKMITVTGSTYAARTLLKDAGFEYVAPTKSWVGNDEALAELKRISTASYSRANQRLFAGLIIKEA